MDIFTKYNFNPYERVPPDDILMDAHRRHVPFFKGCKRVLDLGAGRGLFLRELAAAGIDGLGVDNHLPSIEIGRAHGCQYHIDDIYHFFATPEGRAAAATCDGVYCCFVIEHLDPGEVFELFLLIRTHCAPNVRARFITHNPSDIDALGFCLYGDLTHKRLYVPDILAAMARSQGFARTEVHCFLGMKLGKKDTLRRIRDWFLWGRHKWKPNFRLDAFAE